MRTLTTTRDAGNAPVKIYTGTAIASHAGRVRMTIHHEGGCLPLRLSPAEALDLAHQLASYAETIA